MHNQYLWKMKKKSSNYDGYNLYAGKCHDLTIFFSTKIVHFLSIFFCQITMVLSCFAAKCCKLTNYFDFKELYIFNNRPEMFEFWRQKSCSLFTAIFQPLWKSPRISYLQLWNSSCHLRCCDSLLPEYDACPYSCLITAATHKAINWAI